MASVSRPTRQKAGHLIKVCKAAAAALIMLGMTMTWVCAQEKHIGPASSRGSVVPGGDKIEAEISPIIAALEQAVRQSDASKAAALWSVDGEFIDDAGQITRGRHELKERFSRATGEKERQAFTLLPDGIKHPSANVALVDGVVLRDKDGVKTQTSRFSMVLIKEEGTWLIARATETLFTASNSHEHLEQLAAFVGQWATDKPGGGAAVNFDWAPKGNFIRSTCVFHGSNQSEELSNQVIGWDPRIGKIVSWHFDASGGFAYGQWTHQGNKWIVEIAGITSGGADTTATDIFTVQEANKFTWQSTKRILEGTALPDIEPLTVLRVTGK